MTEFMRAVDIKGGKGGPDALFINAQTPKPTPQPDQAVVRVRAFGLNRMDLLQREGLYPVGPTIPTTMGVEFSGTIAALGSAAVGGFAVGDEVFGLVYGGAYAEYVAVSVRMLLHKPPFFSWAQAAAVPENWMTALQALHEVGEFRGAGQSALWHAGASGVSIAGIQLSWLAGASSVYATAGSDAKCAFLRDQLHVTAAVNYKTTASWAAEILKATGTRGVDFIVDYVGASYFQQNLEAAAVDAHIVLLAFLSGAELPAGVNIGAILRKRLRIEGSGLRTRDTEYQGRLRDRLAAILPSFETGALTLYVDKVFDWTQIKDAHEYMEKNVSMGKIVCTIP